MKLNRTTLTVVACMALAGCATSARPSHTQRASAAANASPSDPANCTEGSIESSFAAHPVTAASEVKGLLGKGASIALVSVRGSLPGRYETADGFRPARNETFGIATPWDLIIDEQWTGKPAVGGYYTEGGSVGCDKITGGLTFSLAYDTRAVIFYQPTLLTLATPGATSIALAWQVVGDRVLVPQPPETIGPDLDAQAASNVPSYLGEKVHGASISISMLKNLIASVAGN